MRENLAQTLLGLDIPDERAMKETVARCVGIVVYYHNLERSGRSSRRIASEIGEAVRWLADSGLDGAETDAHIVGPFKEALMERFGPEVGFRLVREFVPLFDATLSPPGPPGSRATSRMVTQDVPR